MENQLAAQARTAQTAPYDGKAHAAAWDALCDQWAGLNGAKRTLTSFPADALARGLRSGGHTGPWPGIDHANHYRRNGYPIAVTSEPYDASQFAELAQFAAENGLAMHLPPNPWASFWCPPYTMFVVITRPDFGSVKWLPDQLAFEGLPPHAHQVRGSPYPPRRSD